MLNSHTDPILVGNVNGSFVRIAEVGARELLEAPLFKPPDFGVRVPLGLFNSRPFPDTVMRKER